jgi:pyruvate,orthophosphate dikinase
MVEIAVMKAKGAAKTTTAKKEKLLQRVEELHEFNPMLGHRGCRLGISFPEITRMQTRAIIEAACEVVKKGKNAVPEIMVPLVGISKEFTHQRKLIEATAQEVMKEKGVTVEYSIGTMIELPRAVIIAGEIAKEAKFFSFGTNDLTQTVYGFSRDDAGKFIRYYRDNDILEDDPFQTLDKEGVGNLVRMGVDKGRLTRPGLKIGICGEHGGDPASVEFCYSIGLTYVSCSPYRVPIARLAAAQARLKEKGMGASVSK